MSGGSDGSGSAPATVATVGRHVGNLLSRDLVNRIARFAATVLLARALTLDQFGVYNACVAAAGLAYVGTTLGLNDLGARDVAADPKDVFARGRLAGRVLSARLTLVAAVSLVAIAVVAIASPNSLPLATLTALITLSMTANAEWLLRGLERMRQLGNAAALGGITAFLGAAVLTITSGAAESALAVLLVGEVVAVMATWAWAGTAPRPTFDFGTLRPLLRRAWPLAVSAVAMYTYFASFDTILLASIRSTEEAGLYSAPYRIFLALSAVGLFAAYSYLPMLTRGQESGDPTAARTILREGVGYLVAYGAILVAATEAFGSQVLGLLFGSEFASMGPEFVVLSLGIMWFVVGFPIGYSLVASDENRRFLTGALVGGSVNLILNALLIPPFGTMGAAAATATSVLAGSLVWLWGGRMLNRALAPDLAAMTAISIVAVVALLEPRLLPVASILTALAAAPFARPIYRRLLA